MNWMTWVLFVGLLLISHQSSPSSGTNNDKYQTKKMRDCLTKENPKEMPNVVVADDFNGFIETSIDWNHGNGCMLFVQTNNTAEDENIREEWPKMDIVGGAYRLLITKWHIKKKLILYVLHGRQCNNTVFALKDNSCVLNHKVSGSCDVSCLDTQTICEQSTYDESNCKQGVNGSLPIKNRYIINITATNKCCLNCNNPKKKPEKELGVEELKDLNIKIDTRQGEDLNAAQAAGVMDKMADLAIQINGSSSALNLGEGVTGILVKETEPADLGEVSFAYGRQNDTMSIIDSKDILATFSRSVTVSKEAFEKALSLNVSVPFAAVFRFINMAKDEFNSTVLGNEVIAVEMGTIISNLTDKININFRQIEYKGTPSCRSWDGKGSRPNWTDEGCLTIQKGENITCQCSHLTFFAILLTVNETIPSHDLSTLTIITQVGCGLSMFFLSIVLFMHFLLRKTKASKATRILIHLVLAMFLLDFTFLINNYVAKMKSPVVCKIMAALMHYSMLATFTWFAVQAFHLCLQLYTGGRIVIRHYILKVSITSWVLPSIVAIVLLIIGKYGEQVINTSDSEANVAMCWIIDSDIHYIVNIGYYVLVFLFTFTTFIIILSWLFCLKRTKAGNAQIDRSGKSIVTILGLCCMLGVTWGFAFFAYGILRIPTYYIFTVLNSFQGFFLFIYYYNTSHTGEINGSEVGHKNFNDNSTTSTLKTSLNSFENPYSNMPEKK